MPLLSTHLSILDSFEGNCGQNGNKLVLDQTDLNPKYEIWLKHPAGINSKQSKL
jgi:hypothetical protein